jgi:hypothetical protein
MGNPMPAAEFTWDPVQTDYGIGLTSYPLCADGLTEGKIWVDFDLKLTSVQPTGEEMLQLQVWNWDSQSWATVAEYSNIDGSFDWQMEHVNIRSQAMDKVFKIRFYAMGTNSIDILSWYVDNVHVYRACDGPTELTAVADGDLNGIVLNWLGPDTGEIDVWIHWDDGVWSGTSIGTNSAVEFDAAARWEPSQLVDYEGASVTQISFVPVEAACVYSVAVWQGPLAANLIYMEEVSNPTLLDWTTVTLASPVMIDVTQELWIGYHVNTTTGYPAGVDAGPAVDGYGNWMNFGGWQTLLEINSTFDYNWNIQGHLQTVTGVTTSLGQSVPPAPVPTGAVVSSHRTAGVSGVVFNPATSGTRDFTGYNVYRSEDGGEYMLLDYTTETTYLDTDDDLMIGSTYCYMVSAVWEGEEDMCEGFSEERCELWTSIGEGSGSGADSFGLYPNPADDHVFITSTSDLKRVTVYNALGQLVIDEITTGNQYELKTSAYTIGVYMVRVETEAGMTTRTLTVQR